MQLDYTYDRSSPKAPEKGIVPLKSKKKKIAFLDLFRTKAGRKVLIKRLLIAAVIGFLACVIAFFAMVAWFSRDLPDPNKLIDRAIPLSTKIYDRTGTHILYEIHGDQQRTLVTIDQIPKYVQYAAVSAEDKSFYTHQGFDPKGILRSAITDVLRGGKAQGGSTITQQFVKNAILTNEKSIPRKMKELVLSYEIEKNFSKDQILQLYFNEIPYGSTAYGIQSAARVYFGKDIKDVTLGEAAILAALPQAPTYYSPWGNHTDALFDRQHYVLDVMAQQGYITKDQAEAAKKEKITFKDPGTNIEAPHFVMYVKELLADKYDEKTIEQGGLTVITSLDYDKQKIAEDVVDQRSKANLAQGANNAALVSLDAKTGEILSMVGSRDYFDKDIDGNVNVALRKRQPGSSFKPIVYAAALMKGYTPDTIVYDVLTNFAVSGDPYIPKNYTGQEYGPVTLRKALDGSLNISSVKVFYLAGMKQTLDLAKNLGYTSLTDPERYGLTLVLGGGEVTLLEHVSAYTAFARDGQRVQPVAILKVQDRHGKTLEEFKDPTTNQVFDPQIAREMNNILSDNNARAYIFGANNLLTLPGRPVAAKTGTTNDVRDAWTIGYTPSVVTGVWVGNNDNTPMKQNGSASMLAAPIWHDYMAKTLAGTPVEQFKAPDPVTTGKDVLDGKPGAQTKVKIDITTGKLATDQTPPDLIEERAYSEIHDILYYVDKDNPRGPAPTNPYDDPQYANWEAAVQDWAKKNNIVTEQPPTESDDVHNTSDSPSISITSPGNGETVSASSLDVSVQTSAPHGVARVEYYLDDQLIDSITTDPFALHHNLSGDEAGSHTLTAKAFDAVGNEGTTSISVNLNPNATRPSIKWDSPTQGNTVAVGKALSLKNTITVPSSSSLSTVKSVSWYVSPWDRNDYTVISSTLSPSSKSLSANWTPQSSGRYTLLVEMTDSSGAVISSARIRVTVQ